MSSSRFCRHTRIGGIAVTHRIHDIHRSTFYPWKSMADCFDLKIMNLVTYSEFAHTARRRRKESVAVAPRVLRRLISQCCRIILV